MVMNKHEPLHPLPAEAAENGTFRSTSLAAGSLKLIRNTARIQPKSQASDGGNGSSSTHSQSSENDGDHYSHPFSTARRPYLKPTLERDTIFSRRLMQPVTKHVIA